MANVSANTLFHFTGREKGKENLLSILKNGFYPRYCMEDLSSYNENKESQSSAFPMVCFCDIPLTRTKTHTKHYGEYAIGLTKTWGMEKGITPISYIHDFSMLLNYLTSAYNEIVSINDKHNIPHLNKKQTNSITAPTYIVEENLISLFPYLKSYKSKEVIFYDEREWRYIPNIEDDNLELFLSKNDYDDLSKLKEKNEQLKNKKLTFEPNDIRYVIVEKDKEIADMVDYINETFQDYSLKDVKLLTTRIISMEHIEGDF